MNHRAELLLELLAATGRFVARQKKLWLWNIAIYA